MKQKLLDVIEYARLRDRQERTGNDLLIKEWELNDLRDYVDGIDACYDSNFIFNNKLSELYDTARDLQRELSDASDGLSDMESTIDELGRSISELKQDITSLKIAINSKG